MQSVTVKCISNKDSWKVIPLSGELVIDYDTQEVRVGDGKHIFRDLPIISISFPEHLSQKIKSFVEDNIALIESQRFNELYKMINSDDFAVHVTKVLLDAGIDPIPHIDFQTRLRIMRGLHI